MILLTFSPQAVENGPLVKRTKDKSRLKQRWCKNKWEIYAIPNATPNFTYKKNFFLFPDPTLFYANCDSAFQVLKFTNLTNISKTKYFDHARISNP